MYSTTKIFFFRNQSPPQNRDQELMTPPGLNNFRVRGNTVLYYAT